MLAPAVTFPIVAWAEGSAGTAVVPHLQLVRDRMWMWAAHPGALKPYGLVDTMTPIEGAKSMGVSNIIMIRCGGKPEPPFDDYAVPFRALKKVMWSVTGESGATSENERNHVFALAAKMPNLTGVFMDDFFHLGSPTPAVLSLDELAQLRQRLTVNGRKLDLGVTLYTHQLDPRILPYLKYCDLVSLWTWEAAELAKLEENFGRFQTLAPGKRTLLGLYLWDFGKNKPMPVALMKKQCELALRWLREGRIEGMIFLVTNLCNQDLEAVNWTRSWIAAVGDQPLDSRDETKSR